MGSWVSRLEIKARKVHRCRKILIYFISVTWLNTIDEGRGRGRQRSRELYWEISIGCMRMRATVGLMSQHALGVSVSWYNDVSAALLLFHQHLLLCS